MLAFLQEDALIALDSKNRAALIEVDGANMTEFASMLD